MILAILDPWCDVDIDTGGEFAQCDREFMAVCALKRECPVEIEITPVDTDGYEIAFGYGLGYDQGLVGIVGIQRGHACGSAGRGDPACGEVDSRTALHTVDTHGDIGCGQRLGRESLACLKRDDDAAHNVADRDDRGIPGCYDIRYPARHKVGCLVSGFGRLVGHDCERMSRDGTDRCVGIVEIETGTSLVIVPEDRCVGCPCAIVGEAHVVDIIARVGKHAGCRAGVVDHIKTYTYRSYQHL